MNKIFVLVFTLLITMAYADYGSNNSFKFMSPPCSAVKKIW